ncbi:MAG: hypothetical protein LBM98_08175 [Oscillospiraceae bacterium]|jgi:hypothetical protein|nr:hypothetical protein [Oscillospiraceae bacterium]
MAAKAQLFQTPDVEDPNAVKPQVPIIEEKLVDLSQGIIDELTEIKERIIRLFFMVEDDDINRARKMWQEINATLIQSFSLGVFDLECLDCGLKWTVARRQALNEIENYLQKLKKCPNKDCASTHLSLDWDLQISVHELAKKRREAQRQVKEREARELQEKLAAEALAKAAEEAEAAEAAEAEADEAGEAEASEEASGDSGEFRPMFGE